MRIRDQKRLANAFEFALKHHRDQKRKGTNIPYGSHLMQVSGLILEYGGSIEQAMAGLLHDTIEDCDTVNESLILERFGPGVARIVRGCTDTKEGDTAAKKLKYELRKGDYIKQISQADPVIKFVAACDKLHNLRAILSDLDEDGPRTLDRFTGTPAQTRWYYESVREALGTSVSKRLLSELDALLERLSKYVPESNPER